LRLIPAILAGNLQEFKRLVRIAEELTDHVQIDLMDGDFVPTKSISAEELKNASTSLRSEAHLMVRRPEDYISALKEFGVQKVVFHYEAVEDRGKLVDSLKELGFAVGVAVNPETPVTVLDNLADEVDSVLFLSVNPGSYGHEFLPEVLNKVRQLRAAKPEAKIGVDGGVKPENIEQVLESGADFVYVGSAIFLQPDPRKSYLELKAKVEPGVTSSA
jgi:ribulose-phosphate 3-epimerase